MSAALVMGRSAVVPTVSRFLGIRIQMFLNDHPPPHFHARYGGQRAKYSIETLKLLAGALPRRVQGLVLEWAMMHRPTLRENWRRCEQHVVPLLPIPGLDEEE